MPVAVLPSPIVLFASASQPVAVLLIPVVLEESALDPVAVLACPVVSLKSASKPVAVLSKPVVTLWRAPVPSAVLLLGKPPSAAVAVCNGAKEPSASASRRTGKPRRRGTLLGRCGMGGVLVVRGVDEYIGSSF